MKNLFLAIFTLISISAFSQNKQRYNSAFDSLHNFLKINYAGYDDKVNTSTSKAFQQHTKSHKAKLDSVRTEGQFFMVLRSWSSFFKDSHLSIQVPFDTANGKLAQAIKVTEKKSLSESTLATLRKDQSAAIEGIYYTADSTYQVAIVKDKPGFRSYAGIIITSKVPEWTAGQVKFEMYQAGNNNYNMLWYNRYHYPTFSQLNFEKGNPFDTQGWFKKGASSKSTAAVSSYVPPFPEENKINAFFKKIDDETGYLRIGSFDSDFISQIDSVIKTNQSQIESLPNFIIDIRGNGGGADIAYRPLKRIMYTNPIVSVGVDLLATKYNIDITRSLINSISGIPADDKKEYNDILDKATASKSKWYNFFPDQIDTLQGIPTPQKIAVIMNSRCACTAEQFLLEARQSKKVKLYGTATQGVLDYANVREKDFAAGFIVHYPSTRSRRVDAGQGIDNIGIKPDIALDFNDVNWLKIVTESLKK